MLNHLQDLYKNNKFQEIIDSVQLNEINTEKLELKGISALKLNKFNIAQETFEALIKQAKTPSNYYHLGLANLKLNRFSQAIQNFEYSEKDKRFTVPSAINKTNCYLELNSFELAESELKKILPEYISNQTVLLLLLQIYDTSNNLLKLEETINFSKAKFSNSEQWQRFKCSLLLKQRNFNQLIQYVDSVGNFNLFNYKVTALYKSNQHDLAIDLQNQIIRRNKETAQNWYNLSVIYSTLTKNEDLTKGLDAIKKCIEINSQYVDAYHCQSIIFQKLNKKQEAIESIQKAIALNPDSLKYNFKLSELLHESGLLNESLEIAERILIKNPNHQETIRQIGIIKLKQDKHEKSIKYLSKAVELNDTDQRAISYLEVLKPNELNLVRTFEINIEGPSFNKQLAIDIKNHSKLRFNPNGLAAKNGYLTEDLFADKTDSILKFKELLLESIHKYINELPNNDKHHMLKHKTMDFDMNVWATWTQNDGYIDRHIHEESWLSGSYYCSIPEITNTTENYEGYFEYNCLPKDIDHLIKKETQFIKPKVGKLIIFPSYIYHQTVPHNSAEDRISIAFDLTPKSWNI